MKKSLLAIAAATAFTGAAQAQSSVTVYGILDAGFMSQTVRNAGTPGTQGVAGANNSVSSTGTAFGSGAESTSRLGFRGVEDLGGGTSAFFTIEFALTPTNDQSIGNGGRAAATNNGGVANAGGAGLNNRQSFVGIAQKGLGRASIGTQYTPIHEAVAQSDPGNQNNVPGNLLNTATLDTNSNNSALPVTNTPENGNFNAAATVGGPAAGSVPYTVRAGNSIRFATENFSGFVGKLMYSQANSNTNTTTAANNGATTGGNIKNTLMGAGIDFSGVKNLFVTANYQTLSSNNYAQAALNVNGVQTTTVGIPSGTTWGVGSTASYINETQMYFGGTYDFGILKAYAQYVNRKAISQFDSSVYTQRTAQQIGVRGFATKTIEPWVSVGTGKLTNQYYVTTTAGAVTNGGTANVGANLSAWQLGSNYWLSKRTNLYAIAGITRTGNAVYPVSATGVLTAINANSNYVSGYALGLRHTF
jgi:predicted porin